MRKYAEMFCWKKNVNSFYSAKATNIFSAKKKKNIGYWIH